MCYFVHLKITPQRSPAEAQTFLENAAKTHHLYLRNLFPHTQITNGHCSCDYVQQNGHHNGHAVYLTAFLEEVIQADAVKNLDVGWTWSKPMEPNAVVKRLSLQDFLARNNAESLDPEVWYKLNDPDKYVFAN